MTTTYDLGLSSATGSFAMDRVVVEADTLAEAVVLAEQSSPGMKVHCGWAVEGEGFQRSNPQDLEWWMATHMHGVLRTQNTGSETEEGS